ncbi:hypothetical protein LJB93_01040 [Desulfovibrio sp. OttesenSCG-928-F07]|nr:hypothetical protein [Desulfovibrio sp. OttesenSCG-928-F07]
MKKFLIIFLPLALIAGGAVFAFIHFNGAEYVTRLTNVAQISSEVSTLKTQISALETKFEIITNAYNQLMSEEILNMRSHLANMQERTDMLANDNAKLHESLNRLEKMLSDYSQMYQ